MARKLAAFALLLLAASPVIAPALPLQPDPAVEARVDSLMHATVRQLYEGRLDLAWQAAVTAGSIAPNDPRVGLMKFRVLRVSYPIGVYEKERARKQAPRLQAVLDRTIVQCDSIIDKRKNVAAGYMYRGWARMLKAQVDVIARHIMSGASEARKGKKDFDRFYELHPEGDPDAAMILGSYLYFADRLPGFVKLLGWLIRIPSGDRERGLALINEACAAKGYTEIDAELGLAVIDYLFEGKHHEAMEIFERLITRYPWSPRLVEYQSTMSVIYPETAPVAIDRLKRIIDGWGDRVRGFDDLLLARIRWSQATLMSELGDYDEAIDELAWIVERAPEYPTDITPRSIMGIITLERSLGRFDSAKRYCSMLSDQAEAYREWAADYCEEEPGAEDVMVFSALGQVRMTLYNGDVAGARTLYQDIVGRYGTNARTRYVLAEINRYDGRYLEARANYRWVVDNAPDDPFISVKRMALLHWGEMELALHNYEAAEEVYKKAKDVEPDESMFSNMIEGRLLYIKELREHEES